MIERSSTSSTSSASSLKGNSSGLRLRIELAATVPADACGGDKYLASEAATVPADARGGDKCLAAEAATAPADAGGGNGNPVSAAIVLADARNCYENSEVRATAPDEPWDCSSKVPDTAPDEMQDCSPEVPVTVPDETRDRSPTSTSLGHVASNHW